MNDKNTNKEENLLMSNKYTISVSFAKTGIKISDMKSKDSPLIKQRKIIMTEVENYFNSRFPARLLSMVINYDEISKLIASRGSVDKDMMFDIDISISPLNISSGVSYLMPIKDGKFKALLKNNESVYNFITTANATSMVEQNVNMSTTVEFMLFRESELKFSLDNNINFLYKNTKLSSILVHMFQKSVPNNKVVLSQLDHDPVIPQFIIPRMDLTDAIDFIDNEFGFYSSGYSMFIEDNVVYFLNKDVDPKVSVKKMDYEIILDVSRYPGEINSGAYKQTLKSDRTMRTKVLVNKIKISVNNEGVLSNDPVYMLPNGESSFKPNSSARKFDIVRKITNIPHLPGKRNAQYEFIDVDLDDVSFINVNPLTKVVYFDSTDNVRNYRACFKMSKVSSNEYTQTKLRAFRNLS